MHNEDTFGSSAARNLNLMTTSKRPVAPLLITLAIGCFVLFLTWAGRQAATRGSEISDPAYYSKGLRYNTTQVEKRAASVLGWQLQVRRVAGDLLLELRDGDQRPVSGGEAQLQLFRKSASAPLEFELAEIAPGTYRFILPEQLHGEYRARFDFHKDGARLGRQLLLNL